MSAAAIPISLSLDLPVGAVGAQSGSARAGSGEAYDRIARQERDRASSASSQAPSERRPEAVSNQELERPVSAAGVQESKPVCDAGKGASADSEVVSLASDELSGLLEAESILGLEELQDPQLLEPDMVSTAPLLPLQAGLMEPATAGGSQLAGGVLGENGALAGGRMAELLGAQSEGLLGNSGADTAKLLDIAGSANSQRFAGMFELTQQAQAKEAELVPLRGYATSVETPVGQADWGDKIMGKLAWLANQNLSVAEIHVTPPELGPLEVRVQVQNEQTSVTIHAANPGVRELLEQQSQRLRDMLADSGLNLEQFDVSDQAGQHSQQDDDTGTLANGSLPVDEDDAQLLAGERVELDLSWKGELDVYA